MTKNAGWIEQALPINVKLYTNNSLVTGQVYVLNDLVLYAQGDEDASGYTVCSLPCAHCQVISVKGENHAGNNAVSVGDKLYYDSGTINKDSTDGKPFGYALAAVTSGATASILVGFGL